MAALTTHRWLVTTTLLACTFALSGCATNTDDDGTASLGSDELADEGPTAAHTLPSSDEEFAELASDTSVEAITGVPRFQLPFPCGQVWAGDTRTGHSPVNAVDFNRADDIGDTVVAAAAGTVSRVDNEGNRSYGRWIEIDHGNGYRTRYAHLSTQGVRQGQRVSQGQSIGTVGSTGGSSGPHLHFELIRNGSTIRPVFNGMTAFFFGTRNYTSQNSCSGSSGGNTGGGGGASGQVRTNGISLAVRAGPGTNHNVLGSLANGANVRITCQTRGTRITGTYGTTDLWDRVAGGYISDAYVYTGSDGQVAPNCR